MQVPNGRDQLSPVSMVHPSQMFYGNLSQVVKKSSSVKKKVPDWYKVWSVEGCHFIWSILQNMCLLSLSIHCQDFANLFKVLIYMGYFCEKFNNTWKCMDTEGCFVPCLQTYKQFWTQWICLKITGISGKSFKF